MVTKHNSFRRGVTLVELMIAMLILAIVCVSWLEIIGIQSARKEARHREAVERLAGMMDAFMYIKRTSVDSDCYQMKTSGNTVEFVRCGRGTIVDASMVYPLFDSDISPVGYQLQVMEKSDLPSHNLFTGWNAVSTRGRNVVG